MNPSISDIIKKIKTTLDNESTDAIRGRCASTSFESRVIPTLDNTARNYYTNFKRFLKSNLESKEELLKEALNILENMQTKEVPASAPIFAPSTSNIDIVAKNIVIEVNDEVAEMINIKERMLKMARWSEKDRMIIKEMDEYDIIKAWERNFLDNLY